MGKPGQEDTLQFSYPPDPSSYRDLPPGGSSCPSSGWSRLLTWKMRKL